MRRRDAIAAAAVLLSAGLAGPAVAQNFPERTISLAVGFGPGGSTDIAARLLADRMSAHLGATGRVVVENRAGASGTIASEWLRRQNPDGHVLMLVEASSHAVAPAAVPGGTRYHPVDDFTQIAVLGTGPMVLVVNPGFPAQTAAEAIARLRAAPPDSLAYASSGVGSMPHLSAELLRTRLSENARFTHSPYRSGGAMVEAIAKNEASWGIAVLASAAGLMRDGMVRGLAVLGAQRSGGFPDLPTLAESGLPGFEIGTWNILVGPRGMPAPAVERLNRAANAAIAEPALRQRLLTAGVDAWTGPNSPDDARGYITAQVASFRDIVARTGVRLDP
jgi:tripartite-type tricarboxylate transporter receptor subunit TctC